MNQDNDPRYTRRRPDGLRDEDWDDDEFQTPRGRRYRYEDEPATDDYDFVDAPHRSLGRGGRPAEPEAPGSFRKRHPVLMNFLYIILATCLALWMLMWFLDYWTFHGQERPVPDVKGQPAQMALANIDHMGLKGVVSDSVFDSYSRPGTVVEQVPVPGARIKTGGSVYVTIVAYSPKLVTVPDFYNVSIRQARSMFEGLGIAQVREVPVLSEYAGLVLGAKFNGVELQPGARIPVSSVVTLEVGTGMKTIEEEDSIFDPGAIDQVIDQLNIE
ncbi:MAG: PASTA domain-containing protein [[Clostridium] fimetarium]|nr:PASTA domain-containing protein [Alistipes timonensis]MCM1405240.1 PASTA domain-containing protein [[Clostridium] fimetarium]